MEERRFYNTLGKFKDTLKEGALLRVEREVEYDHFRTDIPEIAELVDLSRAELAERRKDSVEREKSIYNRIQNTLTEWETQAARTLLLDKALEYINVPQVKHTFNEWKQLKDGSWEISNLVYKMTYKIWEGSGAQRENWFVSWELSVNAPTQPKSVKYCYAGDPTIATQKKKRYDTLDAAQRYIQGRFDAYVHLFRELCPPVPDDFKRSFCVNGCLLPGYTIAPEEGAAPDKSTVEDLLRYMDDGDVPPSPPSRTVDVPPEPAKETAASMPRQTSKPQKHKPSAQKKKRTAPER